MEKESIYRITGKILSQLEVMLDQSSGKAMMASLRNSIGGEFSQSLDIWPLIFENVPESFLSKDGIPTYEERSIIIALQLYALHQQGKTESCNTHERINFGSSLQGLRNPEDSVSLDRRFNAMITSSNYEEYVYHLRQLVSLVKSSKTLIKINYALLAQDLFWFQLGFTEKIKLRWAQNYYFVKRKKGENSDEG